MRICARRNLFKYQFINVHYTATAAAATIVAVVFVVAFSLVAVMKMREKKSSTIQ